MSWGLFVVKDSVWFRWSAPSGGLCMSTECRGLGILNG